MTMLDSKTVQMHNGSEVRIVLTENKATDNTCYVVLAVAESNTARNKGSVVLIDLIVEELEQAKYIFSFLTVAFIALKKTSENLLGKITLEDLVDKDILASIENYHT